MIPSLLDTDLYKLTMQQAVRVQAPSATARYELIDRKRILRPGDTFMRMVRERIRDMECIALSPVEKNWLFQTGWFSDSYLDALAAYRFDSGEVDLQRDEEGCLRVKVEGPWQRTILWEVPLLAILSQTWYETQDTDWRPDLQSWYWRCLEKGRALLDAGCAFSDFGTRRRRGLSVQQHMLVAMQDAASTHARQHGSSSFSGTSNLHFARLMDLKPVGTVAHEWAMAYAVLHDYASADRHALRDWLQVYPEQMTIALTDTFTTDFFLTHFDRDLAESYNGVRQDSGDPHAFIDKMLAHYQRLGIDPSYKVFVFSDGLDPDKAISIQKYLAGRAQSSFGIGTNLTNDFPGSETLDIVIKLTGLNGKDTAKTSDEPEKATGPEAAVEQAREVIRGRLGPDAA